MLKNVQVRMDHKNTPDLKIQSIAVAAVNESRLRLSVAG